MMLSSSPYRIVTLDKDMDKDTGWWSLSVIYRSKVCDGWEQKTIRLSSEELIKLWNGLLEDGGLGHAS